ncbi:hypothetical protein [Komagataeibacter saccharivorans]
MNMLWVNPKLTKLGAGLQGSWRNRCGYKPSAKPAIELNYEIGVPPVL